MSRTPLAAADFASLVLVTCTLFAAACGQPTLTGSSDLHGQNAYAKGMTQSGNFPAKGPPQQNLPATAQHDPQDPAQPKPPTPPTVTGISMTAAYRPGVIDGLVNSSATRGCGYDRDGWRVVSDDHSDPSKFYWWDIIGDNFGTSRGTVRVGGQNPVIQDWTPGRIRVYPIWVWFDGRAETTLVVSTSMGTVTTAVSIVPGGLCIRADQ